MEGILPKLIIILCLMESIILHEMAHGFVALLFGDPTAKRRGRITLNPIPHIDLIWTIVTPIVAYLLSGGSFVIGGAKPVPVNPLNYRRPLLGDICVSAAGVAANFLIAIVMILLLNLVHLGFGYLAGAMITNVLIKVASLNILLALFNLIPVPPLDGSHLFKYLLPRDLRNSYENMGRTGVGFIILILLINVPGVWNEFSLVIFGLDHFLLSNLIFFGA
jgi:Zn-dependent protease